MRRIFPPLTATTRTGYALGLLIFIRAFFNGALPLMDKTEARYGEIARLMAETGDWVVLQIDYGVPFWAKPPLSTWASALSIRLFGTHEFFVRLPYLLACLALVFLVRRYRPNKQLSVYLPGLVLFSLPEFFLHAGVVSTDTFLSLSVALVMLSFWEGIQENSSPVWRYLLFVGMGLGLLAKGPIVGILTVPPILLWYALSDFKCKRLLRFPIVIGAIISLGIAVPWYVWTEMRSPGFIDYFIVGEHFKRYLDSSWSGDKYGFPKQQPLGMVWLFLLGAVLPWLGKFFAVLKQQGKKLFKYPWALYLLLWLLWTPLFFTSSKSLIHPYTLPVMVPFALLLVHYWGDLNFSSKQLALALTLPLTVCGVYFSGRVNSVFENSSDKFLIEKLNLEKNQLIAVERKSYSSQFYSKGKIGFMSLDSLSGTMKKDTSLIYFIEHKHFAKLPEETKLELNVVDQNKKKGAYQWRSRDIPYIPIE